MACTIVLYGATGYSGRLLAEELGRLRDAAPRSCRIVLAGRSHERLQELAQALRMEYSVFSLDCAEEVPRQLEAVEAGVVLNAAGPFAATAGMLAWAAIASGCHYADINGEADVYLGLRRQAADARRAKVALVSGAGFWAAASNALLEAALVEVERVHGAVELGAVRIAMARIRTFSRGSAQTVWRSLRSHVLVVRKARNADGREELVLAQEPVGKLERSFDFARPRWNPERQIASAASLVDTLAARESLRRRGRLVRSLESYVEAGLVARMAYQLGAGLAPVVAAPAIRTMLQQPANLLADGPSRAQRSAEPHVVLLEIEDFRRRVLVDWSWQTPNVYQFTAHLAAEVALKLATGSTASGWVTPAQALDPVPLRDIATTGPFRGCELQRRRG